MKNIFKNKVITSAVTFSTFAISMGAPLNVLAEDSRQEAIEQTINNTVTNNGYDNYQVLENGNFDKTEETSNGTEFENWDFKSGQSGIFHETLTGMDSEGFYTLSGGSALKVKANKGGVTLNSPKGMGMAKFTQELTGLVSGRTYVKSMNASMSNPDGKKTSMLAILGNQSYSQEEAQAKERLNDIPSDGAQVALSEEFVADKASYLFEATWLSLLPVEGTTVDLANMTVQEKYAEQWSHVDGLFTDMKHEQLKAGITLGQIEAVELEVNKLEQSIDKAGMLTLIEKAKSLIADENVGTLTADSMFEGDVVISGSYTGDITSAKLSINGTIVDAGTTGYFDEATHRFTFNVGDQKLSSKDKVELIGYDPTGKELATTSVAIKPRATDIMNPYAYYEGDSTIKGTLNGEVNHADLKVNGNVVKTGGSFDTGRKYFYINVDDIQLTTKDKVELIAFDKTGEEIETKEVEVKEIGEKVLIVDPYKLGSTRITGTHDGRGMLFEVLVNGEFRGNGISSNRQTFSIDVSHAYDIVAGDKIEVRAYNENTLLIGTELVTIIE